MEINLKNLQRSVSRVRNFTPEQRRAYEANLIAEMGLSEDDVEALRTGAGYLQANRDFHEFVGLSYPDPKEEDEQIISAAVADYLFHERLQAERRTA